MGFAEILEDSNKKREKRNLYSVAFKSEQCNDYSKGTHQKRRKPFILNACVLFHKNNQSPIWQRLGR
jgi:hypothetical protein